MDYGVELALPENDGTGTKDPSKFEEDFAEKDPTGRYIRKQGNGYKIPRLLEFWMALPQTQCDYVFKMLMPRNYN